MYIVIRVCYHALITVHFAGMVQYYPDNQYRINKKANKASFMGESLPTTMAPDTMANPSRQVLLKEGLVNSRDRVDHLANVDNYSVLSTDVHLFYYPWYANIDTDGAFAHWNHSYLPNWDHNDKKKYPTGSHDPLKDDVAANFFPQLGCYSSKDNDVIKKHMKFVQKSGAGVIVTSWYPPSLADDNGFPIDDVVPMLLEAAQNYGIKVALHIEPYKNFTIENFRSNLEYVQKKYSDHPAFYKKKVGQRELPIMYIYDSYRIKAEEWKRLFSIKGDLSIRGTNLDAIFIGLLVEFRHRQDIKQGKFDGFYTYFASNGFSYGSSWKNWKSLQDYAERNSLFFIPSVGPGYIDVRVRPWNSRANRDRRNGAYYSHAWHTLLQGKPPRLVTVTSFNEFHEGTQIEPVIPKTTKDKRFTYMSYEPNEPDYYLLLTRKWILKYLQATNLVL